MNAAFETIAALHREADELAALMHHPWSVVIVERAADVAALHRIGVPAVALADPSWRAAVAAHTDVLVVGSARRACRDLLRAGPCRVHYRPSLPRHSTVEGELRDLRTTLPDATADELATIWGVSNDGAYVCARLSEVIL